MPFLTLLGLTLIAILVLHYRRSLIKTQPVTAEYWVYSTGDKMPDQTALMDRIVGANPYTKRGQNPIGPAEGLVFSDVRWKISLILRSKNPTLFAADYQTQTLRENEGFLINLIDLKSIIKLQFVSSVPLQDKRHLQFLVHVADAVAEAAKSNWIYDRYGARIWNKTDLSSALDENFDATSADLHVCISEDDETHTFESTGLVKVGVRDFITLPVQFDNVMLMRSLIEDFVSQSWEKQAYPDSIEKHGDTFLFSVNGFKNHRSQLRVQRVTEVR
jgi:hypothetical protein